MPPLPFEVISSAEYLDQIDQRLTDSQIFEATIYTLMARTKKLAVRAFSAMASVTDMQSSHGYTLAKLELKDSNDFRTHMTIQSEVHDGLLIPTKENTIIMHRGLRQIALTEAYLLGYNDGIDDDTIKNASDLSEYSSADLERLQDYSKLLAGVS